MGGTEEFAAAADNKLSVRIFLLKYFNFSLHFTRPFNFWANRKTDLILALLHLIFNEIIICCGTLRSMLSNELDVNVMRCLYGGVILSQWHSLCSII